MATNESDAAAADAPCRCKVGTLAASYGFAEIHGEFAARWTAEEASVRQLAAEFNRRLLRHELDAADVEYLESELDNFRELLDGSGPESERVQARGRLERRGVDVDGVTDRFVSHQTVYRHLKNCLDAERETTTRSIDDERARIDRLQSRSETVVRETVERLAKRGDVDGDAFDVLVNFRVMCEDCGRLHDVADFFESGGCSCE